ncbi:MAG: hypothetical protein KTM48_01385, partial [Wolbachia endosymbiont of Pissodes strobi]|nr:hypothetical protein [Wolbachia endosymbiont of Pissodes strobi]
MNYDDIGKLLNLPKLKARRDYLDVVFLYKIVNGIVDCPGILERVSLLVPQVNLRHNELFHIEYRRT